MEALIFIVIIGIILQIFMIVYFFRASNDISKIRKYITKNTSNKWDEYTMYLSFGKTEKAKEALEDYIWEQLTFYRSNYMEPAKTESCNELKENYEQQLIKLGGKWPQIIGKK